MQRWLVCITLAICGCSAPQTTHHGFASGGAQNRYKSVETAPTSTNVVRVRAYVDDAYVRETMRWEERLAEQMVLASEVAEPMINVRFELVGIKRWAPGNNDLNAIMDELMAADKGTDVDVVVAYTESFGGLTQSQHQLGISDILGKHMVIRAMNSAVEWTEVEAELQNSTEEEQRQVYRDRLRRKECAVFLHEFGHLNGAVHTQADGWLMSSSYDRGQDQFIPANADIVKDVLRLRHQHKDRGELMRASAARIRTITDGEGSHGLESSELADLISLEKQSDLMGTATYESVRQAQDLANGYRFAEAMVALQPALEAAPDNPGVLRIQCYVMAGIDEQRKEALEVCSRASERNPDDYFTPLNAAQILQRMDEWEESLHWTQKAEERLTASPRPQVSEWRRIANAYANAQALDMAEKALANVPLPVSADDVQQRITRMRQLTCTPKGRMVGLEERAAIVDGQLLMDNVFRRKAKRADIEAYQTKYPASPMAPAAQCVRDLIRRGSRANLSVCEAALDQYPDCWPVRMALGRHHMKRRDWSEALPHLERAFQIQPDDDIKRDLDQVRRQLQR